MPRARNAKRRFLLTVAAALVISLGVVAIFNFVVDPYGLFNVPRIAGLNALKPRPGAWITEIKQAAARRARPEAVIVGNSRAEIGFDPRHPSLEDRGLVAYNLAVPGLGLARNLDMLSEIAGERTPKVILVGVDFLDFLASTGSARNVDSLGAFPPAEMALGLKALGTLQATKDSLETLRIQRATFPALLTPLGFNPLLDYRAIALRDGYYALFRQRAEESAKALQRRAARLPSDPIDRSETDRLRALLKEANSWQAQVHLIVYPYHAELLMMFDEVGLWPIFERFKRLLADEVMLARHQGGTVTLWDFSSPSAYTSQPIPRQGDKATGSRWYWEAGHFKKDLGDIMLSRILDGTAATEDPRFGVVLEPNMLDDYLLSQRRELALLRSKLPALKGEVSELVRAARVREAFANAL